MIQILNPTQIKSALTSQIADARNQALRWMNQYSPKPRILIAAFVVAITGLVSPASACRDCPFPMKVGEGRWLMPNGQLEVNINQSAGRTRTKVQVKLIDPSTGNTLAIGTARMKHGAKNVRVILSDFEGRPITGQIFFVDGADVIKVKFTCDSCSISDLIM